MQKQFFLCQFQWTMSMCAQNQLPEIMSKFWDILEKKINPTNWRDGWLVQEMNIFLRVALSPKKFTLYPLISIRESPFLPSVSISSPKKDHLSHSSPVSDSSLVVSVSQDSASLSTRDKDAKSRKIP